MGRTSDPIISPGKIWLSAEEEVLLGQIEFDLRQNLESLSKSTSAAMRLTGLLLARRGIPQVRQDYFERPEHNIGTRGSRRTIFEMNGTAGAAIYAHPHFLPHLHYFVFGPNLPEAFKERFQEAVVACGNITSGDFETLRTLSRHLFKQFSIPLKRGSDELFLLAIEAGLSLLFARLLRDSVRQLKTAERIRSN